MVLGLGEIAGLVAAGVVAGVLSTVVSLASIASYPALLAFGLTPLAANVTNTVALMFTGLGAAAGSRPELAGQAGLVRHYGLATALGGATGAALLLITPATAFEKIAPVLIAVASAMLLHPGAALPGRLTGSAWLRAGVFCVAIYIGYFGAAGGVIMFALLTAAINQSPARVNAIKNVIGIFANAVAALGFALFAPVAWSAVAPLATGLLLGGLIGPAIARRLPGQTLRILTAVSGLAVAIKLGLDTYT
ncbi:sulfite exporter TauE/SafE family protein [Acrocarpospora catenulata]|uniref:sulfite exporter TauE/SafE family protein n=1 Tax=Acrocarpospora catenulata TaxID=2836182 RepID=UPI0027DFC4CD|nr:sulfite exporter TauE/SafE family protein [Acrocarpospora catenulata]